MGALSVGGVMSTLSSLSSVIGAANTIVNAVGTLSGQDSRDARSDLRTQQNLALAQLRAQQGLSEANAAQESALQKQRIAVETAASESARRDALKRAVARQRAQYGAQGLSAEDGSGEAVLLGLYNESDEARAERERLDSLRYGALDQDIDQQQRINVLQRTQLQEKQALERALRD